MKAEKQAKRAVEQARLAAKTLEDSKKVN